eukprot:gene3829-6339_t
MSLALLLVLSMHNFFIYGASIKKDPTFSCTTCNRIVDDFFHGLEKTSESIEFTGESKGWTADNEKFLGKYAMTEARMTVALEGVCGKDYNETETADALRRWLCVEQHQLCCPKGTFGKDCKPCRGGSTNPCSGHGDCNGDGFRYGTGKCKCIDNFEGKFCDKCRSGYFLQVADEGTKCIKCDDSCKHCTGPGSSNCTICQTGYTSQSGVCEDVDECTNLNNCHDDNTICVNNPGSFSCETCDVACKDGCTGIGPDFCINCREGFRSQASDGCEDINECEKIDVCEQGMTCRNTPGSFICDKCSDSCQQESGCTGPSASDCHECASGYHFNGKGECTDIDECEKSVCNKFETCENLQGTFSCKCQDPAIEVTIDSGKACQLPAWVVGSELTKLSHKLDDENILQKSTIVTKNITVGPATASFKIVNVTFEPNVFSDPPYILSIVPVNECCGDTFEFYSTNETKDGFTFIIIRTDSQVPWGQELIAEVVVQQQNIKDEL